MFRLNARRGLVGSSVVFALGSIALWSPMAAAQSADTATAEALFEQGRDLLRAGKTAEACPKLAESERIESSTGTLLALAMCHEADGKLASAWAEFVSVEARARGENRYDREQAAHDKAQALHPRLSTLEIRVSSEVAALPGLEVRRDGALIGRGAWNVAVPVDGADHLVEVRAPGKIPWKRNITVKVESDAALLAVPALAAAPPSRLSDEAGVPGHARADGPIGTRATARWGALEWAGVSAAGAGVIALGFGGYFLATALGQKSDSAADCSGNACGDRGFSNRTTAVANGNTATIFGIAGGVLVVGGATLFIVGRARGHHGESAPAGGGLALSAGPAGLGAHFSTQF